jgi:hypothetical protein
MVADLEETIEISRGLMAVAVAVQVPLVHWGLGQMVVQEELALLTVFRAPLAIMAVVAAAG